MKAPEVEKRSKKERERSEERDRERERELLQWIRNNANLKGNRVRAGGLKRHKSTKLVESGTSRKWLPFLFIAERNNKRRGQGRPFLPFAELLCRELSHTVIAEHLEER